MQDKLQVNGEASHSDSKSEIIILQTVSSSVPITRTTRSNGVRNKISPVQKIVNDYKSQKKRQVTKSKLLQSPTANGSDLKPSTVAVKSPAECKPRPPTKAKRKWEVDSSLVKRGTNGWEESLRPRPAKFHHFEGSVKRPSSVSEDVPEPEVSYKKLRLKKEFPSEPDCQELKLGHVVWAKFGTTRWWPAIIVRGEDCTQPEARENHDWVVWFGDYKISELPKDRLTDFATQFQLRFSSHTGKAYMSSIFQAVRVCAKRCDVSVDGKNNAEITVWAKNGFPRDDMNRCPSAPNPEFPIPEEILNHMRKIRRSSTYERPLKPQEGNGDSNHDTDEPTSAEKRLKAAAFQKVRDGTADINDMCIACDVVDCEIAEHHPVFEGGLCSGCKNDVIDTMFAYGDDGTSSYCCICASPGELIICDNADCSRVYCSACIENLVGQGAYEKVLDMDPWMCYFCVAFDVARNGLIRKKSDWQTNTLKLFKSDKHLQLNTLDIGERRPMRVLSLFDGIGTGKYCLDQLGIEVEVYYASEIDQDSVNVSSVRHFRKITQLGPVERLSDVEIAQLCPIDLVIGGSPCNDLSLVNPQRKGLYDPSGTGTLFFDFYRLLKAVQLGNKEHHLFWLFENVASMPLEYRAIISRFLQCDPAMIDSKYFSPQNRARYFWGNIPGLHSPLTPFLLEQNITLGDYVSPCLDRKALVDKVRTITTKTNSLKQRKNAVYPVSMNGVGDTLWVTELETVFGFPQHYTDTGNISVGRRHQLLGKAWSVPVIKHIFNPLRKFFKLTKATPESTQPESSSPAVSSSGSNSTEPSN